MKKKKNVDLFWLLERGRKRRRRRRQLADWRGQFIGTGRVALMVDGVNSSAFGVFGDCANSARLAKRVGAPWYVMMRELTPNEWIGYDVPSTAEGATGIAHQASIALYKPMRRVRYDASGVLDGSGGSVDYPQTASTGWIEWRLNESATRLGVVVGYNGDNCGVARVVVKDEADNDVTTAVADHMLVATAQQAVNRGQIAASALKANGGTLDPLDFVIGTSTADTARCGSQRFRHIPVADGLPKAKYRVRFYYTGVKGGQVSTSVAVDRMYLAFMTVGSSELAHTDVGAELLMMRDLMARNDASTSETYTLGGRVTGSGNPVVLSGNGHMNDRQTALTVSVDGVPTVLYARTASRSRAGNIATLVTQTAHGLATGDVVTTSGLSGAGYNVEGASVTVLSPTSFTYQNAGSDETSTVDTGGRLINHKVVVGSEVVMNRVSNIYHPNYNSGNTAVAGATAAYKLSGHGYFETSAKVTLNVAYDLDISSYAGLMSFSGNDRASFGREFVGSLKVKSIDGGAVATYLTNNDNRETLVGSTLGYSAISDGGVGSVIELVEIPSDAGKVFVQDRTGGSVEKVYVRAVASLTQKPAGYSFGSTLKRYDALFSQIPTFFR